MPALPPLPPDPQSTSESNLQPMRRRYEVLAFSSSGWAVHSVFHGTGGRSRTLATTRTSSLPHPNPWPPSRAVLVDRPFAPDRDKEYAGNHHQQHRFHGAAHERGLSPSGRAGGRGAPPHPPLSTLHLPSAGWARRRLPPGRRLGGDGGADGARGGGGDHRRVGVDGARRRPGVPGGLDAVRTDRGSGVDRAAARFPAPPACRPGRAGGWRGTWRRSWGRTSRWARRRRRCATTCRTPRPRAPSSSR